MPPRPCSRGGLLPSYRRIKQIITYVREITRAYRHFFRICQVFFDGICNMHPTFPSKRINYKKTTGSYHPVVFWRRHPESDRGIADLQSAALPLGYGAVVTGFMRFANAGPMFSNRGPLCEPLSEKMWSGLRGSNSLPPPWQGGALPDELRPQMVPQARVELATRGFSVRCSTN